MHLSQGHFKFRITRAFLSLLATASVWILAPLTAQAGNVGWAVAVGGGNGGGYGGGWRPAAYGPGWGGGYGGWRSAYYGPAYGYGYGYPYAAYYSPPVVYTVPQQPMVLASQPQPAVWYYCEASGQYFPYVQSCTSGWLIQPAIPPTSATYNTNPRRARH